MVCTVILKWYWVQVTQQKYCLCSLLTFLNKIPQRIPILLAISRASDSGASLI